MRRDEFNISDKNELQKLLKETSYGTLCLNDKKFPYATPVNFVYFKDAVYFHGAASGRKYELSLKNNFASFTFVKEYSLIPSYFSGFDMACGATQFFASAFLEGELSFVKDADKGDILVALMDKYQIEGGHLDIKENLEKYLPSMTKTAVFRFEILSWSLKIKAGQNMKQEQFDKVTLNLSKRSEKSDLATIGLMKKFRE